MKKAVLIVIAFMLALVPLRAPADGWEDSGHYTVYRHGRRCQCYYL